MSGESDVPEGYDPTLEQTEKMLDEITDRYRRRGSRATAQTDAVQYARMQMEYARTHPGQLEMPDGSDASDYEINKWQKAIDDGTAGNWETFRQEFLTMGEGFIEQGEAINDPDWTQIGKSFRNLARSL